MPPRCYVLITSSSSYLTDNTAVFHGSPYFVFLTESALTDPTPFRCYVNKKKLFDNLAIFCYLFVVGKNTPPEVYPDQSDD